MTTKIPDFVVDSLALSRYDNSYNMHHSWIENVESYQSKKPGQVYELTPEVLDALINFIYLSHIHKVSTEILQARSHLCLLEIQYPGRECSAFNALTWRTCTVVEQALQFNIHFRVPILKIHFSSNAYTNG